jgi:signal transduction histidine kinase
MIEARKMADPQTYRVLLVEDSPADARLAREVLAEGQRYDFEVSEASTLAAALALLAQREFDVVLLDLSLPDSLGIDGVMRIRAQNDTIPIVVLTGLDDEDAAVKALQQGVQEYLVKGIESAPIMGRAIRYAIERKRIDLLLIQALQQAEVANRAKSEFLSTMSHELRTPLNAIIGFAELMKLEALGPLGGEAYREYARDICLSGNHLLTLINDILDLGRIEAGKVELNEEIIRPTELFEAAARILRERAVNASVALDVADVEGLPNFRADRRKLLQILVNLLSNAIKFTPDGGNVGLTALVAETGEFVITVTDTGIGIAEKDMDKAMMPFGQIDSSLSRRHAGTGLGLPLTKNLVELHGGKFVLTSVPGNGTTVTVRLPTWRIVVPEMRLAPAARA